MFDQGVLDLLNKLCSCGYEAYLVGGVVRDYLLGLVCHDYDACTNATPDQIKEVYKDYQIFTYGEKFGTIGINYDNHLIEITTFRSEDGYVDNRHPRVVSFDANLKSDVLRRDFTINAIAYDVKTNEVIDLVDGIKDLKAGIIRSVGNPKKRFEEDSLRIIRGIRFAARFNFKIEDETRLAILDSYKLLANVSKERITEEMSKILVGGFEKVAQEYYPIFKFLIPELNGINLGLMRLNTNNLVFKLAMLFSDVSNLDKAINNFRFPKVINLRVKSIIKNNDLELNNDLLNTRLLLHRLGLGAYQGLNDYHKLIGLSYTDEDILDEAIRLGYTNSFLAVNGRNVKVATLFNGKEISDCLEEVFLEVISGRLDNNKDAIKAYLFEKYGKARYLKLKLDTLRQLSAIFSKHNANFSIGAGAMLYFRGITDYFNDLDISCSKEDFELVKDEILALTSENSTKWGYIHCYKINNVDIDLVEKDVNVLKTCDLEYNLDGTIIHLETLEYWLNRYKEMGRSKRVSQIEAYLGGK